MKTRTFFAFALSSFLVASCAIRLAGSSAGRGSGNIVKESRQVSDFDRVKVCCGMQLTLTQGEPTSVEIAADDNLLPEITSNVTDGQLVVEYREIPGPMSHRPSQPVQVLVTTPTIHGMIISGGGQLRSNSVQSDRVEIDLSGGAQGRIESLVSDTSIVNVSGGGRFEAGIVQGTLAEVDLSGGANAAIDSLSVENLDLQASGGGKVTLAGSAIQQSIDLSGGCQLNAPNLESKNITIGISGSGDATVWATDSLDVDLSGGSTVEYYGNPNVSQTLSGGSQVRSLGSK
jgi:hypothetical protein